MKNVEFSLESGAKELLSPLKQLTDVCENITGAIPVMKEVRGLVA